MVYLLEPELERDSDELPDELPLLVEGDVEGVGAGEVDPERVAAGEVDPERVGAGEVEAGEVDPERVGAGEVDPERVGAGEVDPERFDVGDSRSGLYRVPSGFLSVTVRCVGFTFLSRLVVEGCEEAASLCEGRAVVDRL